MDRDIDTQKTYLLRKTKKEEICLSLCQNPVDVMNRNSYPYSIPSRSFLLMTKKNISEGTLLSQFLFSWQLNLMYPAPTYALHPSQQGESKTLFCLGIECPGQTSGQ